MSMIGEVVNKNCTMRANKPMMCDSCKKACIKTGQTYKHVWPVPCDAGTWTMPVPATMCTTCFYL